MRIFIASDHAGFAAKEKLKKHFVCEDLGPYTKATADYPDYAFRVAEQVALHPGSKGILICGTGTGMVIAANKVPGVRASVAYDSYSAKMARHDNNANILTLRARQFPFPKLEKVVDTWLKSTFSGIMRHKKRIQKIHEYEKGKLYTYIVPAIIADSQKVLDQRLKHIASIGGPIHLDVMDGKFVENNSLNGNMRLPRVHRYEVHLMVQEPKKWIRHFAPCADSFLIHAESRNVKSAIALARKHARSVGLVLNPETTLKKVRNLIPLVDRVLIMTVHPGQYGSKFVPKALAKVTALRKEHPFLDIQVDGHITPKTIKKAHHAGANIFVSGSFIQNAQKPQTAMQKLYNAL